MTAWSTTRSFSSRGATWPWPAPTRCRNRWKRTMKTREAGEPDEGLQDVEASLEGLLAVSDDTLTEGHEPREAAEKRRAILGMYLDEIRRIKLLDAAGEQALARKVRAGDADAERQRAEANPWPERSGGAPQARSASPWRQTCASSSASPDATCTVGSPFST